MKTFALAVAAVSSPIPPISVCMAFISQTTNLSRKSWRNFSVTNCCSKISLEVTTTSQQIRSIEFNDSIDEPNLFNPLGPPTFLSRLSVGETLSTHNNEITRLSFSPDIFLVKNFLSSQNDRDVIMDTAMNQGMKIAGTKISNANTIRKWSYLTWIDPNDHILSEVMDNASDPNIDPNCATIATEMDAKARRFFVHESISNLLNRGGDEREIKDYFYSEDVQVAKYDAGGRFDNHHDDFSRYLTVLTYLNGVGGTYFPFGGDATSHDDEHDISLDELDGENTMLIEASIKTPGQDGILVVGNEGVEAYLSSSKATTTANANFIIEIQPGDAIAFYNYKPNGEKEWRSIHSSLTVPQVKWIATCWFRSEALTGPFGWLRKQRLLDESVQQ